MAKLIKILKYAYPIELTVKLKKVIIVKAKDYEEAEKKSWISVKEFENEIIKINKNYQIVGFSKTINVTNRPSCGLLIDRD